MKTIGYCTNCASILFTYYHNYQVNVTKELEWCGGVMSGRERTPKDEDYVEGTSVDRCSCCGEDGVVELKISVEVAGVLLEAKKEHGSISLILTEEELDGSYFTDVTRLKKEILRQSL